MSSIQALRAATSLRSLARLLKFKPKAVSYLLYFKPQPDRYQTFQIPKKLGGVRNIMAPSEDLKLLQRRLADVLVECIGEENKLRKWKDDYAHGFTKGRSFITNASPHTCRRYVFNVDLEDFFGTINFGRVRGFFIKNRLFRLHPDAATVIAQIASHNNVLPQGSPCSPVISNLIGHVLDVKLCRLAAINGCYYTRYADDLTFSTNRSKFPDQIARPGAADGNKWACGVELDRAIASSGFRVNASKTRMQFRRSRQDVTGVIVNRRLNTRIEYRKNARAMTDQLFDTGRFFLKNTPPNVAAGGPQLLIGNRLHLQEC